MLPIEWMLFVPSLLITPLMAVAMLVLRKNVVAYARVWPYAIIVCCILCGFFLFQVLTTLPSSARGEGPANPGGFSSSAATAIGVYLLETGLVIPAFPVLILLALLPPQSYEQRTKIWLASLSVIYVLTLTLLVAHKNYYYVADYNKAQQRQLQQVDQFEHLRR